MMERTISSFKQSSDAIQQPQLRRPFDDENTFPPLSTSNAASRKEGGCRFRLPSPETPPLVSIIVVVFRARGEISPLLESIFAVERPGVEVIVIDGGSDDGTAELIREYDDRIDYWISEPDTGIYNAMNKGLAVATGDYVLHLNAGDRLRSVPSDALRRCMAEKIDVVCCPVLMDKSVVYLPKTGPRMLIENIWHHQGTFYRRLGHPGYDEGYRVYGDFDLNQRLAKEGRRVRLLNDVVAEHQNNGISVTGLGQHSVELWKSVSANAGPMYVPIAFVWHKLYFLRRCITMLRRYLASRTESPTP